MKGVSTGDKIHCGRVSRFLYAWIRGAGGGLNATAPDQVGYRMPHFARLASLSDGVTFKR